VSIEDAAKAFEVSRSTLFRLTSAGLPRYKRHGDRKTYVSRSETARRLSFKEVKAPYDTLPPA